MLVNQHLKSFSTLNGILLLQLDSVLRTKPCTVLWRHSSRAGWIWNAVNELFSFSRPAHLEKQDTQAAKEKLKPKVKRHLTSKSDEPDLQESALLKKIIAYQRKLLVQLKHIMSFSYVIQPLSEKAAEKFPMRNTLVMLFMSSAQHWHIYCKLCVADRWKSIQEAMTPVFCLSPPAELLCQKLLQHADAGTLCRLCHQLYPPVL